jgi:hypothetical protein
VLPTEQVLRTKSLLDRKEIWAGKCSKKEISASEYSKKEISASDTLALYAEKCPENSLSDVKDLS